MYKRIFYEITYIDQHKAVIGLGCKTIGNETPRPVKLVLRSAKDKTKIFNNTGKLKSETGVEKTISIAHDMTQEERQTAESGTGYTGW